MNKILDEFNFHKRHIDSNLHSCRKRFPSYHLLQSQRTVKLTSKLQVSPGTGTGPDVLNCGLCSWFGI